MIEIKCFTSFQHITYFLQRESNARFIRWSDGSLQLQIGNEVLDISVQDARHDQAHLFLRHDKVRILIHLFLIIQYHMLYERTY